MTPVLNYSLTEGHVHKIGTGLSLPRLLKTVTLDVGIILGPIIIVTTIITLPLPSSIITCVFLVIMFRRRHRQLQHNKAALF